VVSRSRPWFTALALASLAGAGINVYLGWVWRMWVGLDGEWSCANNPALGFHLLWGSTVLAALMLAGAAANLASAAAGRGSGRLGLGLFACTAVLSMGWFLVGIVSQDDWGVSCSSGLIDLRGES
jgi:hypothetical protein